MVGKCNIPHKPPNLSSFVKKVLGIGQWEVYKWRHKKKKKWSLSILKFTHAQFSC